MPAASILIKPASSGCNIACKYCFYHAIAQGREVANFGIMSDETLEELVRQTIVYAEGFASFAFQGGEPTLAGLDFFKRAVELQKQHNKKGLVIQNTIQTNGTLITEEWAEFLAKNDFLVGLSLDGPRGVNDFCRVDRLGGSIFDREMETVKLFRKHGVKFNICSVVTAKTADKIGSVYNFFKQKGFGFMQFIPCLDAEECMKEYSLEPRAYGEFLCRLFDMWYNDFMSGKAVEIRQFTNYAQIAAGFAPEECGMCGRCTVYFAVESDGSVYPCDFYTQDEMKLGNISEGFNVLWNSKKAQDFMEDSIEKPKECLECGYYGLCRGGCRRWRDVYGGGLGVNYLCEGYKLFFSHCGERVEKLGNLIKAKYRK